MAPNSPHMAAALKMLKQRVPLGACDLETALDTAAKSFTGDSKSPRAVVYIGDGSSRANVLSPEQFDRVVSDLAGPAGAGHRLWRGSPNPRADARGAGLPHRGPGGAEQADVGATPRRQPGPGRARRGASGRRLPPASSGPKGLTFIPRRSRPCAATATRWWSAPRKRPPPGKWKSTSTVPPAQKLAFDIPALKSDANNGYLVTLVDQAKVDGGRTLPLVDSAEHGHGQAGD